MTVVSCGYGAVRYFLFSFLLCPEKVAVEGTEISSLFIYFLTLVLSTLCYKITNAP